MHSCRNRRPHRLILHHPKISNDANDFQALTIRSGSGKQIDGSILATGSSEGMLLRIDDVIAGDLTVINKKDNGAMLLQGYLSDGRILDVKGNLTFDTNAYFLAGRTIQSSGNLNITSRNGLIIIMALGNDANTLRTTKNLTLKAAESINLAGKVSAGNNITVNSAEFDIFSSGSMTAGDDINLTTSNGDIRVRNSAESTGSVTSVDGNIKMTAKAGNIDIDGELLAQNGKIDLKTSKGNIQIGDNTLETDKVISNGNMTMKHDHECGQRQYQNKRSSNFQQRQRENDR